MEPEHILYMNDSFHTESNRSACRSYFIECVQSKYCCSRELYSNSYRLINRKEKSEAVGSTLGGSRDRATPFTEDFKSKRNILCLFTFSFIMRWTTEERRIPIGRHL